MSDTTFPSKRPPHRADPSPVAAPGLGEPSNGMDVALKRPAAAQAEVNRRRIDRRCASAKTGWINEDPKPLFIDQHSFRRIEKMLMATELAALRVKEQTADREPLGKLDSNQSHPPRNA